MHFPKIPIATLPDRIGAQEKWDWLEAIPPDAMLQWPPLRPYHPSKLFGFKEFITLAPDLAFYSHSHKRVFCAQCTDPLQKIRQRLSTLLPPLLAPQLSQHGVFIAVHGIGVLLTGKPNSGKSLCAYELLEKGHQLICDDAPYFFQQTDKTIIGGCPDTIFGLLAIRERGIVEIHKTFGYHSLIKNHKLDLIIQLNNKIPCTRKSFTLSHLRLFQVPVPVLTLPLALYKNAAMLVESAVHLFLQGTQ